MSEDRNGGLSPTENGTSPLPWRERVREAPARKEKRRPERKMRPISPEQAVIGRRLEEAIRGADMMPAEVAEQIGRTKATIYKWMDGVSAPNATDMEKLARATGKPVAWFFGGDGTVDDLTERIANALTEVLFRLRSGMELGDAVAEVVRPYGELPESRREFFQRLSADLKERLSR